MNPLSKAVGSVREVIAHHAGDPDEKLLLQNMLQLFVIVLRADGKVSATEQQAVATLVRDVYGEAAASQLQQMLTEDKAPDLAEVCAGLASLTAEEKEILLRALFTAAFADNQYAKAEVDCMHRIARELGIPEEAFQREETAALEQHNRRMKLVRSSTGLIASVVVIGIFILTATFLKAVLFGLILAYFFLPLQQRYTSSFLNNGILSKLFGLAKFLLVKPFAWIMGAMNGIFRKSKKVEPKPESEDERVQSAISRACNATVLTVVLTLLLIVGGLVLVTISVKPKEIDADKARTQLAGLVGKATGAPLIGDAAKELKTTLDDPKAFEKLKEKFMSGSGEEAGEKKSVMSSTGKALASAASILGAVGNFFLNTLLAIFFFSFFLGKMAAYHRRHSGDSAETKEGDYLVQSLFETSWLPTTSEETLRSAAEVINEVFFKLKTWVRGYLWIIIIETVIYITVFLLLGVPYAVPLGMVAGLTVLLPFLGPLVSVVLTIGVCVVTGHADLTLLGLVGATYVTMNMIVEQLFLYPAFVGEALGLNILETLIVVLLGGLFAGLAGMIFAVPVASVLKFLIPRLYQSFFQTDELELPERGEGVVSSE
ncbi:MAG: AI-2E family transporter [Verrucomicrobiota bacterium]|nr:AI-2E family transporter [Verrucomicrobiota bacterium]